LKENLARFGRRYREYSMMQVLQSNEINRGITNKGATIDLRSARVRSYADVVQRSEGLFHGGSKINGAPRRTSGYAKFGRTNQLPGPSIRWEAGVVVSKQKKCQSQTVLVSNTSSQSCLPSLVEDPSVLMKLVQ
ncbi:hypothetical protein Ancab_022820, partial [Ancistrocladus abbreviatus]